jgi:hypothetical protein
MSGLEDEERRVEREATVLRMRLVDRLCGGKEKARDRPLSD